MSARLDQALERLNAAVAALESQPHADANPNGHANAVNADEIAEIRQLVDQAMTIISAQQTAQQSQESQDQGGGYGTE